MFYILLIIKLYREHDNVFNKTLYSSVAHLTTMIVILINPCIHTGSNYDIMRSLIYHFTYKLSYLSDFIWMASEGVSYNSKNRIAIAYYITNSRFAFSYCVCVQFKALYCHVTG